MNSKSKKIDEFKIDSEQLAQIIKEFGQPLISDVKLNGSSEFCEVLKMPGVYFFVMRIGDVRYRLYVGQSTCVFRRMNEYSRNFQPRSADDSKIRFVKEALEKMVNRKMSSPVTIELYVKKCNKDNLKIEEHEAIKEYESLINMLPKMNRNVETNSDTRRKLEEGYRAYFRFFRE